MYDLDTITATAATVLCKNMSCEECNYTLGVAQGDCPKAWCPQEEVNAFVLELFTKIHSKYEIPWSEFTVDDILSKSPSR